MHRLARRDDVPLYTLEPPYEAEVADLLEQWTPEQVALYFTLRVYWSEAGGQDQPGLAEHLRKKRTSTPALSNSLTSVADIDRVWARDFPSEGTWRTRTEEPANSYLAEIAHESREIRGRHMARVLVDLVGRGERVFAVVGCSHVIRQEQMIRETLVASETKLGAEEGS